jgi:hypothetical protein
MKENATERRKTIRFFEKLSFFYKEKPRGYAAGLEFV